MLNSRNYGLDVLRACAILLVLASHSLFFIIQIFPQSGTVKQISYFCGFWGVELFFILSGFLIGKIIRDLITRDSSHWIISFWIRRWFRTIPCYFLFLGLNVIWFYYLYSALPKSLLSYFIFAQNLGWEHPDFFPEAWSLSVEEYFYLIFPILILLLLKCGLRPVIAYLTGGTILLLFSTMLRLVYVVIEPSLSWDSGIRKVVIFRFDSLMYGVYLSIFIDRIRRVDQRKSLFFIGLIALLASMIAYFSLDPDHSFFLKTFQFSITSIGFMLVIPYMLDFRLAERTFVGNFFRKTALWSYSMYLSNFLIYNVIQQLIFSKYFTQNIMYGAVFCIMLLIFSCYLVSSVIYKLYEYPLMNLREPVVVWLKKSLYRVGFHRQFTTP